MSTDVISRVREDEVQFISLQFIDILGNIKSVTIPSDQLEDALEDGIWFDGSSIQGFARIYESDRVLVPDPATYRVLPWSAPERRRARIICDVHGPDGEPATNDPRTALKRVVARATALGYIYNTGPEIEFFIFERSNGTPHPVPYDVVGYFDFSPRDKAQQVRSEIVLALKAMGIHVEMSHHEVANGQHEIDFRYADAVTSADNAVTFKAAVRAVAASHNLYASFMPKPIFGINGSGMHCHQSFAGLVDGHNRFYDPDDAYNLSALARSFVAGQLVHARALSAIVAPTVNSYKRLTPGYEAPVYICWAHRNRSALIRVPSARAGKESGMRVELRCPDPSANPYLAFAAMLAAGLDGIEKGLEAPEMVNEDIYDLGEADRKRQGIDTLPGTLAEALEALAGDEVLIEALGRPIVDVIMRARKAEWEEYRMQVTPWELNRYLETA